MVSPIDMCLCYGHIRYHFLRDHVEKGDIDIAHVGTDMQLADIFTKPLDEARFSQLGVNLVS